MEGKFDRFAIPDAEGAEPIENIVARLRKDISFECAGLLRRAKKASAGRAGTYRISIWESRINRIIETQATTFSIGELRRLRRECHMLSEELGRFES